MAFPKLGGLAPAFSLLDQSGNKVSLKDFFGNKEGDRKNVVLYFYPKAMTPGCTVQACGLRDAQKELAKLDTVALGVSPDPVVRLQKFIDKEKLNFTLLSDEDHAVAEKYGCWGLKKFMGREFMGILRTTFIIGKDGKLKHIIGKVNTKTHHDDVTKWIKENLN
ncbi:MAG TPA: thioredoxin-dependent thiol peroxidase [Spongiibacteraceae bacterium]|jgi:peroxiredoxin Q/BCP